MYIVSQPKPLTDGQYQALSEQYAAIFPQGYLRFLQRFGEGTYRGWMNVQLPDREVLEPFAEYDLWEHDESSPITQQQITQCVAIGTTVDGDFLAVHPPTSQLLWLPRHAEQIETLSLQLGEQQGEETYALVLDEIYSRIYGGQREGAVYYEPWTGSRNHMFLRLPPGTLSLQELSGMCRAAFTPDLIVESSYSCHLFYRELGGYVRYNYANKQEVAIMYEQDAGQIHSTMEQWLLSKGCQPV
ncbi:hypothetical protein [Paenibacillus radicis (ex Gao et al. 2016)]|uniref:SMI1/KNR4 family protein n=1 Tax=Paenibacillus radicis (ex Gao et al. 2016) TaxID=1737354 RepID=A0A917M1Y7_9BACL|nr:hypothetical protein [Paenibacillus radicis (ex Gao et al. 2016)]GGG72556.1 hypothetical protein GCM10010918_30500 [Paenibacillus radicis (ex Gao et al. 2016)]